MNKTISKPYNVNTKGLSPQDVEEIKFSNRVSRKLTQIRIALENNLEANIKRDITVTSGMAMLLGIVDEIEFESKNLTCQIVEDHPIWTEYLINIKGIGLWLASSLVAEIRDIGRFDSISKLWAYAGLTDRYCLSECDNGHKLITSSPKLTCPVKVKVDDTNESQEDQGLQDSKRLNGGKKRKKVKRKKGQDEWKICGAKVTLKEKVERKAPRRKSGYHYFFNTKLQTLSYLVGMQLVKQGDDVYQEIYKNEKVRQANLHSTLSDSHVKSRARRKIVKIFYQHLWVVWRLLDGLLISKPYVIERLNHQTYIKPPVIPESIKDKIDF